MTADERPAEAPAAPGAVVPVDEGPPPDAAAADEAIRLGRRRFFRDIASDAVRTAATLVGAAGVLRETTREMADTMLAEAPVPGPTVAAAPPVGPVAPPPGPLLPFRLEGARLILIDQRRLPDELVEVSCETAADVAQAIRQTVVRGAPTLGQVAAAGLALAAGRARLSKPYARRAILRGSANALAHARPSTAAVRWSTHRILASYAAFDDLEDAGPAIADALRAEAESIIAEAALDHATMARLGAELLPLPDDRALRLLVHGSTGPLGGGEVGTALGVIAEIAAAGRDVHVFVPEGRPWLDGARLTTWELARAEIPCTLLADAAVGWLFAAGEVDAVLVGAERIAANGDVVNLVGTYPLAALAARHGVPFYVVAPTPTLDAATPDGSEAALEKRPADEVTSVRGTRIAPPGVTAINPAVDVTPADLVSAIVTEAGVLRPPYGPTITSAINERELRHPAPVPPPEVPIDRRPPEGTRPPTAVGDPEPPEAPGADGATAGAEA